MKFKIDFKIPVLVALFGFIIRISAGVFSSIPAYIYIYEALAIAFGSFAVIYFDSYIKGIDSYDNAKAVSA